MNNRDLMPPDMTRMEAFIVHNVLCRVKERILSGRPSGQIIDEAIKQALDVGVASHSRRSVIGEDYDY